MTPELVTVTCERAANGGTFVARHDRRVVFVRYAAPGETVVARLLDPKPDASFWRAECIEVLDPGPDRVPSVWPESGPDGIGGADFAHLALPAQRRIKTHVVRELLQRAKLESPLAAEVGVEPAPHDDDGLRKRTRAHFAVDEDGRVGMRGWRRHTVFDVGENPLVTPEVHELGIPRATVPPGIERIDVSAPADGGRPLVVVAARHADRSLAVALPRFGDASVALRSATGLEAVHGDEAVTETVGDHRFRVSGNGFWQAHREAPATLTRTVLSLAGVEEGVGVWDLYAGAGLYSAPLGLATGGSGRLTAVEGNRRAAADAAANTAELPQVEVAEGDVGEWVAEQQGTDASPDVVVLDPPRAGAGVDLMRRLCALTRDRIVYVSCDAATLARDLAAAQQEGWQLRDLRAFDLFPHTHHVECVALLERA